jgi:tRNA uridine 5-carboxymethylaminomethyl modification enzyme
MKIAELVKRHNVTLPDLFNAADVGADIDSEAVITTELEIKYAGYFERERIQADKMKRMGDFTLPTNLDYDIMRSLTLEARQKLGAIRPSTLAQASRIPGVSPNDLQNLLIEVERQKKVAILQ